MERHFRSVMVQKLFVENNSLCGTERQTNQKRNVIPFVFKVEVALTVQSSNCEFLFYLMD